MRAYERVILGGALLFMAISVPSAAGASVPGPFPIVALEPVSLVAATAGSHTGPIDEVFVPTPERCGDLHSAGEPTDALDCVQMGQGGEESFSSLSEYRALAELNDLALATPVVDLGDDELVPVASGEAGPRGFGPVPVSAAAMAPLTTDEAWSPRTVYRKQDGVLVPAGILCSVNEHGMGCVDSDSGTFLTASETEWRMSPVPPGDLFDAGQSGWFVLAEGIATPLDDAAFTLTGGEVPVDDALALAELSGSTSWETFSGQWWPILAATSGGVLVLVLVWVALHRRRTPR